MKRTSIFIVAGALLVGACTKATDTNTIPAATVLSAENANHIEPRFSPDGKQVAYWSPDSTGYALMVAQADLGAPRMVAHNAASVSALSWSPDGLKLAYADDRSGNYLLAVVSATGAEARLLSTATGREFPVEWHPDGDRVSVLTTNAGSYVTRTTSVSTGAEKFLLPSQKGPYLAYWSPDGTRLAYMTQDAGKNTIWMADNNAGNAKQLTTEGFEFFNGQSSPWSADGTTLTFVSKRTGTEDIYVVSASGGAPRQITRDIRDDGLPVWSPDGRWIAYASQRGGQSDVWAVPSAGGESTRITDDVLVESLLQWVGGSERLGFASTSSAKSVWAMDIATGAERQLTPDSIVVSEIRPAPNGDEVAYLIDRGGAANDLAVLSLSSGVSRIVVSGTSFLDQLGWSPDGKRLLYLSYSTGNPDIWTVSAAGGEPTRVTSWPQNEFYPIWSTDGSKIFFISDRDSKLYDLWSVPGVGGEPTRLTTFARVAGSPLSVSPVGEVFFAALSEKSAATELFKLTTDGKLQSLWNRGSLNGVSPSGFTPGGDSALIVSTLPEGGRGTFLISTRTGEGRRLGKRDERVNDITRDGMFGVSVVGAKDVTYSLYNLRDGTSRVLNTSPIPGVNSWLSADDKTFVILQSKDRRRIVTVDVKDVLAKAK